MGDKTLNYLRGKNVTCCIGMLCFASAIVHILGCTQLQTKELVISPSHKKYTLAMPEKGWEQIKIDKEDVALWHKQHHAMIALISTNIEDKKYSLDMLNNQLFIGIKEKEMVLNETTTIDNQNAIHTRLDAEMDNCRLRIDSYIIRAEDIVYDLACWAPFDSFDYAKDDFVNMIRSFRFTQPRESSR